VDAPNLLPIIIQCDELLEVVSVQVLEDEYGIPDQLLIGEQGLVVDGELHLALPRDIREGEGLIPLRVLPALRRGLALLMPGHVQAHEDGHLEELGLRNVQGRLRELNREVVGLSALLGFLESGLARLLGGGGDQELGVSRLLLGMPLLWSHRLLMVCLISSSGLLLLLRVVLLMRLRANSVTVALRFP
jgi:hypothetical protein